MKLHANMYQVNKQPSPEEGSVRYEIPDDHHSSTGGGKTNRCNRCLQLMKLILYLELILFIGWIGCVFITNYYQVHSHNDLDEQDGASEWSRDSESLDSTAETNSVLPDKITWATERDNLETTTVKSEMETESMNENENVTSDMEAATNVVEPDDANVKSTLLLRWLESVADRKNNWDDSSSKSTSSEEKFEWGKSSNKKSALNTNLDRASSIEHHFGATDENDEIDLNYLLTLPLWHSVVFASDSLDKIVHSDEDLLEEDAVANARLVPANSDSMDRHWSRQARSTNGQKQDSSSSSSSEESTTTRGESHPENSEASNGDECPTILDDEGNVIDEPKDVVNYIRKNWVRWLEETDIPECEKPKVAKSVTVDKCGKFVINCVIDKKEDTPTRHHRHTRNTEKSNDAEENCKQRVASLRQDLEAWRAKIVTGGSSDPMVQEIHEKIGKHVFTLIIQAIVNRTSGRPHKTNEEWLNSLITMKEKISESMDSEHRNLLVNSDGLTLEMGTDLGKMVETAVDIDMNCRDVLSSPSETRHITMMIEREKCLQGAERMTPLENEFAAEIVPGESTNLEVMALRRRLKATVMFLIINMAQNISEDYTRVLSSPVDVTDEEWTSHVLGLKQEMAKLAEDTVLREQLQTDVSSTQKQTNQLREIADYYLHTNIHCSMVQLAELMGDFNMRRTRAVEAVSPTPTVVTCTLEDDDIQFGQERQERLDRYNQSGAFSLTELRTRPFIIAIDEELSGIAFMERSEEEPSPSFMPYMNALKRFVGNTSSNLKNETYTLLRDIVLELKYLDENKIAADGYDLDSLMQNWMGSCLMHIHDNYTAETILMAAIKVGEFLNLRYSAAEGEKNCGDEFTPVYGTFTYVGDAPEKSFVRRWRHIFGEIVRLYFVIHNPEALPESHCTGNKEEPQMGKPNEGAAVNPPIEISPAPLPTSVTCTLDDDRVQFEQERKERFDRYDRSPKASIMDLWSRSFLNAIEKKLGGSTPTENVDDVLPSSYMSYIDAVEEFVGNTSSDLKDEGYRLLRDIVLEVKYLEENKVEAESYGIDRLVKNWTSSCLMHIPEIHSSETVLMAVIKAGEALNLHYSGVEDGKKCGDEFTPVYGTFTYVGAAPEKYIVQRWRHIFRGIVRLYFRIYDPKALPKLKCTSNKESPTEKPNGGAVVNRLGKRSIGYPIRKSENSMDVDEKNFGNEDNRPLIKMVPDVDAEPVNFDLSQDTFFDKMEMLSAHIDRLHEMYEKFNELNDDYVSKEFPVDMSSNYKY